jgi:NAD-dependent deacetylase
VLARAARVVVFTGAGVSAESGVPTFRGAGGLWKQFRPEQLATPDAFARDPALVWEWYAWRRGLVAACRPNAAHRALAAWMRRRAGVTLVTQNVDDLHERAGTPAVVKLHGSLFADRCSRCGRAKAGDGGTGGQGDGTDIAGSALPTCDACGALLRPGVVWFGEMLPADQLATAFAAAGTAEACLVVGTSGAVYPAAGIVHAAREAGAAIIVVDPGDTEFDGIADVKLTGPAGELLPLLLA